ncbi:MAG: MFS transporter [Planctomycetes bacterium]|nr:MFS transporter [Planctomycetota bacterium]
MSDLLGPTRGRALRTSSWVAYDLANTVYSATLTFLLTPYIKEHHGSVTGYSITNFASMVLAALLVPMLGALSDQTMRTRRYLTIATLGCIAALACCGLGPGPMLMLGCFFIANVTFNVALLFYNALLPSVAEPARSGRISALGVGVGYAGTILVLVTLLPLPVEPTTKFAIAAAMFLVFALPCMLLVKDRRPRPVGDTGVAVRKAYASLRNTLRELPRHRALFWFLLANFCIADVLNTAILFFAELTRSTFAAAAEHGGLELLWFELNGDAGLTTMVMICGLCLNGLALVFGLSIGRWTDRAPLAVMLCSALALLGALGGGALFAGMSPLGYLLTLVVLGSFGLTGTWSAGRKIVLLLAPADRIGEYFGLYGITMKLSVFGAVIYALVRDAFDARAALLSQSPQLLLGLLFLSMVRLPKPQPEPQTRTEAGAA